jgi:hypothetical protein
MTGKFPDLFRSCIFWWPGLHCAGVSGDFDEFPILPSGVTVTNNGTFTKTDLGNNKSVVNFNGSTNYISLSDCDDWYIYGGDFTICAWIKYIASDHRGFITQKDESNFASIYGSDRGIYISGTSAVCYCTTSYTFMEGGWYHLTIQRSGNAVCIMYANGVQIDVTELNPWSYLEHNISSPLYIGYDTAFSSSFLNGNIKDLMIWKNRLLTQPEIKLLMNRTNPVSGEGMIPGPYDYWRLS